MTRLFTLMLLLILQSCVLDEEWKQKGSSIPVPLDDGWRIATPTEQGVAPDSLAKIYQNLHSTSQFFNTRALLIAKNGKLIFETYLVDDSERNRRFKLQSSTKSLTALAVGVALDSGWIDSLNESICVLLPGKCPADGSRDAITLDHLLNMESGLGVANEDFSLELYQDQPSDPLKYFLAKPLFAIPGDSCEYRDVDPHLVAAALQTHSGHPVDNIIGQTLFKPMGITDYTWDHSPGGWSTGAFGAYLRPRDFLKIAQFALDSGAWNGTQLVNRDWIRKIFTVRHPHLFSENGVDYNYGYYWWRPAWMDAISTWGHGGQFALSVPSQGLAVVMVSLPDSDGSTVGSTLADLLGLLEPVLH